MSTLKALEIAWRLDAERPEVPASKVAEDYVAALPPDAIPQVAAECLAEVIREARRERVEREEKAAQRRTPTGRAETEYRREMTKWRRMQTAERQRLAAENPEEYRRRYTLDGAIERFREDVRAEVLTDLGATFVLPDGRAVTWGSATVGEHKVASEAALVRADANLSQIARHEEAIELLRVSGSECLAEVTDGWIVPADVMAGMEAAVTA